MRNFKLFGQFLAIMIGFLFFAGCQQEEIVRPVNDAAIDERNLSSYPSNVTFWGIDSSRALYKYTSGPPATLVSSYSISGLRAEEKLMAIDFRPANRTLYGVSDMNLIYMIATSGLQPGVATLVSPDAFTPAIEGKVLGFDFDPVSDRIFIVTDKNQNLQISPTTGQVLYVGPTVTTSSGGTASVNGIAFANNFQTTSGTLMYDLDMLEGKLYKQSSTGMLTAVGSTGLTITGEGGFDISRTGSSLAVLHARSQPVFTATPPSWGDPNDRPSQDAYRLYTINLKTAKAESMGQVLPMIGLAIQL